ncbi:MAG: CopG family ribbon-helix-helix protein [Gammaproteobacteria bacterium]|nr:CopG family ribbon-helix-helix protein [Gammaproteobacteria bacterium]MDE0444972.1 CopG family ribbon-helix-helix protein [Gammaproteobacteria bacterium]
MSATVTLRLDDNLKQRLDRLSKATQRTKSFLAAEAIREFVDLNEWQIGEIEEAVAEADREEFASEAEVRRVLGKWRVGGG